MQDRRRLFCMIAFANSRSRACCLLSRHVPSATLTIQIAVIKEFLENPPKPVPATCRRCCPELRTKFRDYQAFQDFTGGPNMVHKPNLGLRSIRDLGDKRSVPILYRFSLLPGLGSFVWLSERTYKGPDFRQKHLIPHCWPDSSEGNSIT